MAPGGRAAACSATGGTAMLLAPSMLSPFWWRSFQKGRGAAASRMTALAIG